MKRQPNQTSTTRWLDPHSYQKEWGERSQMLLELFLKYECLDSSTELHFVEYGCGPYSPFSSLIVQTTNHRATRCDITAWDTYVHIVDLNKNITTLPDCDVSVFSGVLEYLDDIENVLKATFSFSNFILCSYAFLPQNAKLDDSIYIQTREKRVNKNGWRNHLTVAEFTQLLTRVGVVSAIGCWGNNQVLFCIRGR